MRLSILAYLIFLTFQLSAQRYWVATTTGNWNNTANWSTTSGGAGGASVPGPADLAIFNGASGSNGNCNLDIAPTIAGITVNGYTGTIDLLGFTLTTTGINTFTSGSIVNTGGSASLNLSTGSTTTFNGTAFTVNIAGSTGRVFFNGSTFGGTVNITKSGTGNDNSTGNNIFNGVTTITNISDSQILLGNGNADQFNGATTFNNNGSYRFYFAYNHNGQTTTFASDLTLNTNKSGGTDAWSFLAGEGTNTNFTVAGNLTINCAGTLQSNHRFLNGNGSAATYGGTVNINNSNTNAATDITIGSNGTSTYNSNIVLTNSGGAGEIYFNANASASSTQAAAQTLSIGGGGFTGGRLALRRFTQAAASQTLILTGTSRIDLGPGSSFGGDVTVTSPRIFLDGATISGNAYFEKTGTTGDASNGGNIISGTTTIVNSSDSEFNLANTDPDTFQGLVSITNTGTSRVQIGISSAGNLFNGGLTITHNGNASTAVNTIIARNSASSATINGNLTLTSNNSNASSGIIIALDGTVAINGDIIANSTDGRGVYFGNTNGVVSLGSGFSVSSGTFSTGTLSFSGFTQAGTQPSTLSLTGSSVLSIGPNSEFGGNVSFTAPQVLLNGCTFQSTAYIEKSGSNNDNGNGGNTFNSTATIVNSGSGYLRTAGSSPDIFNDDLTVTNSGTNLIYLAHASAGNEFNGNIILNATSGTGIYFSDNAAGSSTQATGRSISIGGSGFTSGELRIIRLTQLGTEDTNLNLGGTSAVLRTGPGTTFGGNIDFRSPQLYLDGITVAGTSYLEKTGATNDASLGGNVFTGQASVVNSGSGYLLFGNGTRDQFLSDVVFDNTGSYRIYFAHNHSGQTTTFASNLTLNSNKSGGADQWSYLIAENGTSSFSVGGSFSINCLGAVRSDFRLLNGTGSSASYASTVAINVTNSHPSTVIRMGENGTSTYNDNISVANSGGSSGIIFNTNGSASSTMTGAISAGVFTSGTLNLNRFSQIGAIPENLTLTGSAALNIGPGSSFEGDVTFLAPSLLLNGATYQGTTHLEKTGSTNDSGSGDNIFSAQAVIVNNGSGFLRTNGNNTFNGATTILNNSSSYVLLELTTGSTYNGDVTFTNGGSSSIRVAYQGNSVFNGNIIVNNPTGTGILFCENTGTATLASPSTITVGGSGFAVGELRLKNFLQTGATTQTLTLTGSSLLTLGPSSSFDGDVTFTSPRLLLHGATYNGGAHLEKTSVGNDDGNGGNIFNQFVTLVNSGDSYLRTGASSPDIFQGTLTIVNSGASTIRLADNSSGNQFNGNIELNSTFGGGIYFCNSANGNATLAATRTIAVGGFGVISGDVRLIRFTQVGATAQNLSLSGIATLTLGPNSTFDGDVDFTSPGLLLNGTIFNGTATLTKTGASNDTGAGGNTFNAATSISTLAASGQLITANSSPDVFNDDLMVSNFGSNIIYLAHSTATNEFNGNITFESGLGSGGIYFCNNSAAASATLNTGGSLLVGGAGFIDGRLRMRRFTQLGGTAQTLTLTGTALLELGPSSTFNGNVDFRAPQFELDGTTFNGTTRLEKTGATNNDSQGNNVFNGVTTIANSGSGYFRFAVSALDQFNNDLILENTGTSTIRMADVIAGSIFDGNIQVNSTNGGGIFFGDNSPANATLTAGNTITVGSLGFSLGELRLDRFIQQGATPQNLTLTGTSTLTIGPGSQFNGDAVFSAPQLYLSGGTFNGTATLTKTGATGNTGSGNNVFNSTTTITNAGTGVLRTNGNNTFNGVTTIVNSSTSDILLELNTGSTYDDIVTFTNTGSSNIRVAYNGTTAFNENVIVNSTGGTGIYFSENAGGTSTLAATKTIVVGVTGFSTGDLRIDRFTQTGATPQVIALTGNAGFRTRNSSTWNGNLTVTAPQIYLENSTFNGVNSFTKTGPTTDTNSGGNTFNGTSTFVNAGVGTFRLANTSGDTFNGDVTFNQTTGSIQPAYNVASSFLGNVTVDGTTAITFGANNGSISFSGGAAQTVNRAGTASPIFRRLIMNKSGNSVTLNTGVSVTTSATFTSGIVNTDATNLINFADNSTVSGGSNTSHIDGPVTKTGNDAFTFPTGDNGVYRTIAISAPSNTTHAFTAEYFFAAQAFGGTSTFDPSFFTVSACEYWILNRTVGTSNVNVTLSWNSSDCSGPYISDLAALRVTRWNGSSWVNHGNGGTTGNASTGTVITSAPITSFSPITLASTTSANPLPIELTEFRAVPLISSVEVHWTTLSELNNDYFTVERSKGGTEFEEIAFVKGAGTTTVRQEYAYEDLFPLEGISYYRLKQTDFDKTVSYSEIVKVNLSDPALLSIYPNPVKRSGSVLTNTKEAFALFNNLGQMVLRTEETNEIKLRDLPPGIYMVKSASGKFTRLVIE